MPKLGPVSRRVLVRTLRDFGFEGPFSGGKHQFMTRENLTIRIPNPHKTKIGVDLLVRILRQAEISREEWLERI